MRENKNFLWPRCPSIHGNRGEKNLAIGSTKRGSPSVQWPVVSVFSSSHH